MFKKRQIFHGVKLLGKVAYLNLRIERSLGENVT